MSRRRTLFLLLLCLTPLLLSATPGAGLPIYSSSDTNAPTSPAAKNTTTSSSAPNCTDLSNATGTTYPSCWDTLGMNQFMFRWNSTAQGCEKGEIWSTCFLRLAYGMAGYDCSRLGSLKCTPPRFDGPVTDPQVFYAAFNIYEINTFFSTWQTALYALESQPVISALALTLSAPGAPRLTTSSLLAAIINNHGLDEPVDAALVDLLPSGPKKAVPLDTSVTYYSTQLSELLAGMLTDIMSDGTKAGFMWLARQGQMVGYAAKNETGEGESVERLEASLALRPVPVGGGGGDGSGGETEGSVEGDG